MPIKGMKWRLAFSTTGAGALLICSLAQAVEFTNNSTADAFVRALAPTLNYGGAGALAISGASATNGSGASNGVFDSFIRFNAGAMVTNFNSLFGSNNWVISSATLDVTEFGAPPNALFNRGVGRFEVRWLANDNWIEGTGIPNAPTTNGITYNDEPPLLNSTTDESLGSFSNAGVDTNLSFSLALPASFVNNLRAGGEVGLYLRALEPSIGFTFDSRSFSIPASQEVLVISAVPRPGFSSIQLSGADVTLTVTNGAGGSTYFVCSSTNLALPLQAWQVIATNQLAANGGFSTILTNAVRPEVPQQFFSVRTQ